MTDVRQRTVERDGHCRLAGVFVRCDGPSEWAHTGDHRRFKTRGLPPEERHRRDRSLMLCQRHHQLYDGHRIEIEEQTERGTDGPLRAVLDGTAIYAEPDNDKEQ